GGPAGAGRSGRRGDLGGEPACHRASMLLVECAPHYAGGSTRVADPGEKPKGSRALRDSPRLHTSRGALQCFVESGAIAVLSMLPPPPIVESLLPIVEEFSVAAGVDSSAFLPQPTATITRTSAISARAKSFRIVCTFTSSHVTTPTSAGSGRVFFLEWSNPVLRKKHHSAKSGVGPASACAWFVLRPEHANRAGPHPSRKSD